MKTLFAAVLAVGCAGAEDQPSTDAESSTSSSLTFTAAQQQQMLDLVNYPLTDVATLQTSAGLSASAAKSLITARNGADGLAPSADDFFFTTVAQLDAVPNVGATTLSHLAAYAAAHPAPAGETVKTVAFRGWQSQAAVWGVNHATDVQLDAMLDNRAVTGLLKNRPFNTVAQMSALPYMGANSVGQLLGASAGWWNAMRGSSNLAGRFDGAVFDERSAEVALQIVNQATAAQLTAHGITASAAAVIIAHRSYSTLAQVAAVSGVGSATMNHLLTYAQSGQWSSGGSSCVSDFQAAVSPHLPDLLFMSESDRPMDLVSFAGAGTAPLTGASLMALVGSPAGYTAESRDPANFYVDFEPNTSTSDMNAGTAVQAAIAAQLTGVVYIAIHRPPTDINVAEVEVYLVGITRCGDVVGLHSVSIET